MLKVRVTLVAVATGRCLHVMNIYKGWRPPLPFNQPSIGLSAPLVALKVNMAFAVGLEKEYITIWKFGKDGISVHSRMTKEPMHYHSPMPTSLCVAWRGVKIPQIIWSDTTGATYIRSGDGENTTLEYNLPVVALHGHKPLRLLNACDPICGYQEVDERFQVFQTEEESWATIVRVTPTVQEAVWQHDNMPVLQFSFASHDYDNALLLGCTAGIVRIIDSRRLTAVRILSPTQFLVNMRPLSFRWTIPTKITRFTRRHYDIQCGFRNPDVFIPDKIELATKERQMELRDITWSPYTHPLFPKRDREVVMELVRHSYRKILAGSAVVGRDDIWFGIIIPMVISAPTYINIATHR